MSLPRLSAYVLAGDPAWIEASIRSYYHLVTSIVVSYDETATSWNGTSLPVQQCLDRVRAVDDEQKVIFLGGSYFRPERLPLDSETVQRAEALQRAGQDADWVLQLDSDEVLSDPVAFLDCLREADERGFGALEYPSRQLYQHLRGQWYLERSSRLWQVAADYPGPLAVRSGTVLTHCRQAAGTALFRVDVADRNTDPSHPRDVVVHRRVPTAGAVLHYSWIRSVEDFERKVASWGHAQDRDWSPVVQAWKVAGRRPWRALAGTPLRTPGHGRRVRLSRIRTSVDEVERRRNGLPG